MSFRRIRFVGADDLYQIHEKSLKLLSEIGIQLQSEEALRILKKHGAKVDGNVARFTSNLVNDALKQCPSTYRFDARNKQQALTIGDGIVIATNAGCIYIQDMDHGRRLGTLKDYINIQKLYQASPTCNIVGYTPVDTTDIAPDVKHLYMMLETLRHTDKPLLCWALKRKKIRQLIKMVAIAIGKGHDLSGTHITGVGINPTSPLAYSQEAADTIIECCLHNQPIFLAPAPMTGISSPIQLPGTIVLQNAEILAGVVLIQLLNPGNPVVYMPGAFAGSMKHLNCIMGSPEIMLMNSVNVQLALELYHLPTRSHAGSTDAKSCDIQAGLETMQNMMMSLFAGVHMFHLALGLLDSAYCTCLEKMIVDEEIFERMLRLNKGIEITEASFSTDIIQEVGINGIFVAQENTRNHCRETWEPLVSIWEPYEHWESEGSKSVLERANAIVKDRLNKAPEKMIDEIVEKELLNYIRLAENEKQNC
jgi:trimethylamine--corrinoid protein Co-methyltransferase